MSRKEVIFDPSEDINLKNNKINSDESEVIQTVPTSKYNDYGIEDRSQEKSPSEIIEHILDEMKNEKVVLTPEQKIEYENLSSEEDKKLYLFQLLRSTNFGKLNDSLDELGNDLDKILNRDRMDIKEEEIAELIKPISSDEAFMEQTKTYTDLFNKVFNTIRKSYVTKRNRYIDGQLDGAIDVYELTTIRGLIEKYFKSHPEFTKKFTDSYKLRELSIFFNDMNIESRMRYELNKEIAGNVYGIDPDSFDVFMNAVYEKQRDYLRNVGIDKPTDLQKVYDKHAMECKHLLVKLPDAKERIERGEFIYKSSFLEAANKAYEDEIKDYKKYATNKSIELWSSMANDLFNDPIKYRERKKKEAENNSRYNNGIDITTRRAHSKKEVSSFMDNIRKNKSKTQNEIKNKPEVIEETTESKVEVKEVKNSEKVLDYEAMLETVDDSIKNKSNNKKENSLINELLDVDHNKDQGNFDEEDDLIKETVENSSNTSVKQVLNEEFKELSKPKERFIRNQEIGFDKEFHKEVSDPDTSILKSSMPTHIKMRAYRESYKVSRELYLPNSNYAVKVKRIEDFAKLNYMLSLLQDMTDIDTNLTVKYELINTLFSFLEFEQETTFSQFLKATHESDLSLLFMMLAIMNIREDDDKIPFKINYLLCSVCDSIVYLKNPLTLDLKSEFMRVYPVNKYVENKAKYLSSDFETIEHAYRASSVGKLFAEEYEDELFKYKVIYSLPNLYKKYTTLNEEYQVAYRVMLEQFNEGEDFDQNTVDLLSITENKSYLELLSRYRELQNANILDVNEDLLEGIDKIKYQEYKSEYDKISSVLSITENIKNTLSPIFSILFCVDSLVVTAKETNEVIDKLNHQNIYNMIQTLSNLPEKVLYAISDKVLNKLNENDNISIDTNIVLDSTELEGMLEWEKVYQFDRELNQVITEDQVMENYVKNNPSATPQEVENRRMIRKLMKERIEKGRCSCGSDKLYVNYTNLLFFSLSSR